MASLASPRAAVIVRLVPLTLHVENPPPPRSGSVQQAARANAVHKLIEEFRSRSDLGVVERKESWLSVISKGREFVCEVTAPRKVLGWHARVKSRRQKKEVWSDGMDDEGYESTAQEKLEAEMAVEIAAFVDRVSASELCLPLGSEEKTDRS